MNYWSRFKLSWRQTSNWNKLMVILTMVVAGSTALYTHYAKKQFTAMDGQLAEMRSTSRQTDQLIRLYQQQLSELHRQATDTHELAVQAKNQADRTKDVADRALVQAIATNKLAEQAKRSADISEMSSEAVDRPVLGLEEPPRLLTEIQTLRLTFKNYGAAEVSAAAFESVVSSNDKNILNWPLKSGSSIPPQGRKVVDWLIGGMDFDALKRSNLQARIYVRYCGPYYQGKKKSYDICERWQYDLRESTFTVSGYCDGASGFSKVP